MKAFSQISLATLACVLAITPVAAQANTRAGDYSTNYSNSLGDFGARWTAQEFWFGEEDEVGAYVYALIGGAAVIIALIVLSSGTGEPNTPPINQSPGAA